MLVLHNMTKVNFFLLSYILNCVGGHILKTYVLIYVSWIILVRYVLSLEDYHKFGWKKLSSPCKKPLLDCMRHHTNLAISMDEYADSCGVVKASWRTYVVALKGGNKNLTISAFFYVNHWILPCYACKVLLPSAIQLCGSQGLVQRIGIAWMIGEPSALARLSSCNSADEAVFYHAIHLY